MLKLWCLNNLEYVDTRSWLLLTLKHGGTVLTLDVLNKHMFYLERLSIVLITGVKSSCLHSKSQNPLSQNFILAFWEHTEYSAGFNQNEVSRISESK